jgi:hypothetical protein
LKANRRIAIAYASVLLVSLGTWGAEVSSVDTNRSPYTKWTRGPSHDPSFFSLGVWLQNPANAARYRTAGFNTYVGLWQGPTESQLAALRKAGMLVVCEQNEAAIRHLADSTIIGWMHGDEPDNAQPLPNQSGYGPPIVPREIVESYRGMRQVDPSRPVVLNLGQGVAWDEWYGRGSKKNHPEDYPKYLEGCDIASFDIYPVVHDNPQVAGKLEYVANGVKRLVQWGGGKKIVWNCVECTHISNSDRKPTPHDVRAEAWMSLIHGSQGLIFFVHEFKPSFREAALLEDPVMLSAVTALNRQIGQLAPMLNERTVVSEVSVKLDRPAASLAAMLKRYHGVWYLFAVEMTGESLSANFVFKSINYESKVEVIGENRFLSAEPTGFTDRFGPWDVHLYRIGS